jgi:hypothetical protein
VRPSGHSSFPTLPFYYLFNWNCPIPQVGAPFYEGESARAVITLEHDLSVRAVVIERPHDWRDRRWMQPGVAPLVWRYPRHFAPAFAENGVAIWKRILMMLAGVHAKSSRSTAPHPGVAGRDADRHRVGIAVWHLINRSACVALVIAAAVIAVTRDLAVILPPVIVRLGAPDFADVGFRSQWHLLGNEWQRHFCCSRFCTPLPRTTSAIVRCCRCRSPLSRRGSASRQR